ncbi:MAG: hypothetical protein ABI068_08100 [Ktedonobacterales bacterium]
MMTVASADAIMESNPLATLDPRDPWGVLANQEVVLTRSAQLLASSDPARSQWYLAEATTIADYLVQNGALESAGKIGWGLTYAWDAFGDGTTNPANQMYGFQTALVSRALLATHIETFAFSQLTQALGLSTSVTQATFDSMVTIFWQCGMRCLAAPIVPNTRLVTTAYALFMACYPVVIDRGYLTICQRLISSLTTGYLSLFPLIELLYAIPICLSQSLRTRRAQVSTTSPTGRVIR